MQIMKKENVQSLVSAAVKSDELRRIAEKVFAQERVTDEEALILFEKGSLPFLGTLANYIREDLHGDKT